MVKSNYAAAIDVIAGKYGNGEERKRRLWEDGFDPSAVQSIVNALLSDNPPEPTDTGHYLEVEVDLTKYDGLTLQFKGVTAK